jgi:ribosomal-protein-alanine N-acetyltransferase
VSATSPEGRFLTGSRLYLRTLREEDVDGPYLTWLNDAAVCQGNSHHVYPYTRPQALEYVRQATTSTRELILAVVHIETDRHIGNVALSGINAIYRTAEFSILLGDATIWGKGFGREAGRLLLAHGFYALNLNRVGCGTFATNEGMKKLARELGMKEEGVRRQAAWKDGRFVDVVEFGILREEFEATR